jgi:protein required for attachment to host cells
MPLHAWSDRVPKFEKLVDSMRVRIVVADESEARFYDIGGPRVPLRLADRVENPSGRLRDRDLKSDRPGRVFDRAPTAGRRRGAVAHHATGGERHPHKHEAQLFARRIVRTLEAARREDEFDRLVLMAGPPFLGTLRAALQKSVRATLIAEIPKDLVHQTEREVRVHVPREIFRTSATLADHS